MQWEHIYSGHGTAFRLENRGLDFIGYRFYPNKIILRKRVLKGILNQTRRISKLKNNTSKRRTGNNIKIRYGYTLLF